MKSKKFIIIGAIFSLAIMSLSLAAIGAESSQVISATVTPGVVSVILSTPSVAYGTLPLSTSNDIRSTALSSAITATNNGTVTEALNIRGTDTTNGTTWTLNSSPATTGTVGANQFAHRFDADASFDTGTAKALSTSNQTLAASVAASGTQAFVLQMNMPTSSTDSVEKTTTVTVQAVAP